MGRMDRTGRIGWITGASSGIGRAVAAELAGGGWRLGIGARRITPLREVAASLAGPGPHAALELDVCDPASVAAWAEGLRQAVGQPDLVVYSAGWGIFEKVHRTSDEDWDRTIRTNLTGLFLVTKAVLPGMLDRGAGHLVNILSVAARTAFPKNGAYNASKFGALGFTEALRGEVRGAGIRVTAVLPGATDTPFWDALGDRWDRARMMPPSIVARAVREAAEAPPEAMVEEIRIAPILGNL